VVVEEEEEEEEVVRYHRMASDEDTKRRASMHRRTPVEAGPHADYFDYVSKVSKNIQGALITENHI